jgi:hypothetical protein
MYKFLESLKYFKPEAIPIIAFLTALKKGSKTSCVTMSSLTSEKRILVEQEKIVQVDWSAHSAMMDYFYCYCVSKFEPLHMLYH